jgi:flagellar assembly protein FliH
VAENAEPQKVQSSSPLSENKQKKITLPIGREYMNGLGLKREHESFEERIARIEKEAYEKGFEQGRKDGMALEEKQAEEKGKLFQQLFQELGNLKAKICNEIEGQLLKLAMTVARKTIREEVKIQPKIIQHMVRAALAFLVDKHQIKILINPEDMEEVRKILPEIAAMSKGGQFQVIEDQAIGRGGCFLETNFGAINATLEDQMGMIEKELEQCFKAYEGK